MSFAAPIATAVGAGLSFIGGRRAQNQQAEQFAQTTGINDARYAQARADTLAANAQTQRNFETALNQSVRRRVHDARMAGISPLAALGMPGANAPSFDVAQAPQAARASGTYNGFTAAGEALDRAGEMMYRRQERKERRAERRLEESHQLDMRAKAAEIKNVELQIANSQLRRAERMAQLSAATGMAEHDKDPHKGKLWIPVHDNLRELGPTLGPGQRPIINPEYADVFGEMIPYVMGEGGRVETSIRNLVSNYLATGQRGARGRARSRRRYPVPRRNPRR